MEGLVYIKAYDAPEIDKKEILRYAGVSCDDNEINAALDSCINEAKGLFSYKLCYSRYPISVDGDEVDMGFASVKSHSLAICLNGCSEILLFCATVGHGIDRLIAKYSVISPSRAVLLQAIGSERVESLCDLFCDEVKEHEAKKGSSIRPRFSPGYGDLPIELQREIFLSLDCARRIGVNLGENMFMTPTKSVTAIIGIKNGK